MFLVVMLHYSLYTRYYSGGIAGTLVTVMCVVCVPLFFAVNGALLLPRPLDEHRHYRKVLNIVIIVSIWKVLAAIFFIYVDGSQTVTIKDFCIFLLGGNLGGYPTGYFWFMNALIAVYLILPLAKMAFDSDRRIVLHALMAVLFGFTVGKDTVSLVLQGLGTLTHHDFASIMNSIDEYYIFGSYGYVLLYFLVGGFVGSRLVHGSGIEEATHGGVQISQGMAVCGIIVCYVVTVLIQRYQHAVKGVVLTVENGYWHEYIWHLHATYGWSDFTVPSAGYLFIQWFWKFEFDSAHCSECTVVYLCICRMSVYYGFAEKDSFH